MLVGHPGGSQLLSSSEPEAELIESFTNALREGQNLCGDRDRIGELFPCCRLALVPFLVGSAVALPHRIKRCGNEVELGAPSTPRPAAPRQNPATAGD